MQDTVAALGYTSVVLAQPSLLLGDRAALGQPLRAGEVWAARLMGPFMGLVPRAVRPVAASAVARALVAALAQGTPGVRALPSGDMHR